MAISTDTLVDFFGTQDLVTETSTPSLGSSGFTSTAAIVNWTNDDDAPEAAVVFRGTWNTAPGSGEAVLLYSRMAAISSAAEDMTIPSTTNKQKLLGSFSVDASTEIQVLPAVVGLPNMEASQVYQFFLENQTAQSLSSNWTLNVTPRTQGPST
jgi:hypothetical protein